MPPQAILSVASLPFVSLGMSCTTHRMGGNLGLFSSNSLNNGLFTELSLFIRRSLAFHLAPQPCYVVMQPDVNGQQRRSERLQAPSSAMEPTRLVLPQGCDLVADTFVVFQWQDRYCALQSNVTLYCWGQRRSGAVEHVLEKYGWTHSPQLRRVNSKMVSDEQWRWLQQVFMVVLRLFDDKETGDTVGRVHWLNIMECRLVFELLRRECYYHHRNLYPKASLLPSFLKRYGVEVESWPAWYSASSPDRAVTPSPSPFSGQELEAAYPGTPSSGSSSSSADGAVGGSLGDREWLSDVHIANLMFLLLHGLPRMGLPLEMRDLFQCLYPMTDELFVQMLQRSDGLEQAADPHRAGSLPTHARTGGGVTFAFINPSNNHWRLIVLDGMHQQVVVFDPLGTPLPQAVMDAISTYMGPTFQVTDLLSCLQAEGWNCGIWAIFIASRYVSASVVHMDGGGGGAMTFRPRDGQDDYAVLEGNSTNAQRQQNRRFAREVRRQYATLLLDAQESGRLLYTGAAADQEDEAMEASEESKGRKAGSAQPGVARAGMARSAARGRRFINAPLAELVWIDLTDDVGAAEVEQEDEVEQSYEDLADNFIEFREDNLGNTDAASLRYSLPAKLQSDGLQQQIAEFRGYRRQRFSLFRRGPLVEETTISGNIKSLLRFLGYLHYEQPSALAREGPHSEAGAPLDMTVFALPNINLLVLNYVEWLEQRRGRKRQDADDSSFQPVSCATVSNYLNGLVSIVKFQLRHDFHLRDPLLDQLRNLRSQAESYAATQKRFEKVHPEWCSWQELQRARERCRAAFDQMDGLAHSEPSQGTGDGAYVLCLRELCLLCLFTICPPPRCSIIRLLEWDKTLVLAPQAPSGGAPSGAASGRWVVDLTDLSHAAARHKTHKRKGALQLPLPLVLDPYLTKLRSRSEGEGGPVFPARVSTTAFMNPTPFTNLVKSTFVKYTEGGKAPNPSLLRSIFTTWLYGLRYDTEDAFLAQIKASSAQWKAHSEQIAATVYNKQLVYQQREFAVMLQFCEAYSARFAYDAVAGDDAGADKPRRKRSSARKRQHAEDDTERLQDGDGGRSTEYVVERLVDIREDAHGLKQVLVKWENYRRRTWEPYESIRKQLPEMVEELEQQLQSTMRTEGTAQGASSAGGGDDGIDHRLTFLQAYIAKHHIGVSYRWGADQVIALELAASLHQPPIKDTVDKLVRGALAVVHSA